MKLKHVLAGALAVSAMAAVQPAAAECGRITIADMNWASAEFAAYVDKIILENGYGCEVELVPGDTMPTSTSMMEKGEPDIAPLPSGLCGAAVDAAEVDGPMSFLYNHYYIIIFYTTAAPPAARAQSKEGFIRESVGAQNEKLWGTTD